jgi:hypothetical protein
MSFYGTAWSRMSFMALQLYHWLYVWSLSQLILVNGIRHAMYSTEAWAHSFQTKCQWYSISDMVFNLRSSYNTSNVRYLICCSVFLLFVLVLKQHVISWHWDSKKQVFTSVYKRLVFFTNFAHINSLVVRPGYNWMSEVTQITGN